MKIDGHPFPGASINILDFGNGKAMVQTSSRVKEVGSVDPKSQVSVDDVRKAKHHARTGGRYGQGYSRGHLPRVTLEMLLMKYQRQ